MWFWGDFLKAPIKGQDKEEIEEAILDRREGEQVIWLIITPQALEPNWSLE